MATKKENSLIFRGKPLTRSGKTIYYGNMADPFVAVLQISDTAAFEDLSLPTKVSIQILSTNEELSPLERIKKRTDKNTLYDAVHIASVWLARTLEEEKA